MTGHLPLGMLFNPSTGYNIEKAIYFDGTGDSLQLTPVSTTGNKKFTFSCWLKTSASHSPAGTVFSAWTDNNNRAAIAIEDTGFLDFHSDVSSSRITDLHTESKLLDPTAWFNLILVYDSTVSTPSGSSIFYMINGQKVVENGFGNLDAHVYPSQNGVTQFNTASTTMILGMFNYNNTPQSFYNGYMAEVQFLDGIVTADGSEFGEYNSNGIWVPKDPSDIASYGTNGFYLDFENGRNIGLDAQASSTHEESTVSFLHHFAGDDGDTHTADDASTRAAKDSSSRNHSMTFFGNAQIDTAQSKFSGSSVLFDGAGDGITVNNASEAFTFPGDFTIEMWVRFPAINTSSGQAGANSQLITNRTDGSNYWSLQWEWLSSIGVRFYVVSGGSVTANMQQGSNSGWSLDTWYHVAVVRQAGTVNIYRDGTSIANSTAFGQGSIGGYNDVTLGNYTSSTSGDGSFYGYMDELRISKRAVYKANFTAPSAAFSNPPAGNHFTTVSMGVNNVLADSCVNSTTHETKLYPALDPLTKHSTITLTNDNLTHTGTDINYDTNTKVQFPLPSTGKFYFELEALATTGLYVGVAVGSCPNGESGNAANKGFLYNQANGKFYAQPITANTGDAYGNSWTTSDVIGVAIDMTNGGDMWFGKQTGGTGSMVWQNSATTAEIAAGTTTNAAVTNMPTNTTGGRTYDGSGLFVCIADSSASGKGALRFDSGSWSGTAPTGFGELTQTITGVGNYSTFNPIASSDRKGGLSDGNLRASGNSKDNFSTMAIPLSGKWYFEGRLTVVAGAAKDAIGVAEAKSDQTGAYGSTVTALYAKDGTKFINGSSWESYGSAYVAGDTIGVYINDGQVTFYKNNTTQGTCGSAFTTQIFATTQNANAATVWDLNFGQKSFTYTPPTGAKALSTFNLPEPSITDPSKYFQTQIWTGTPAAASSRHTASAVTLADSTNTTFTIGGSTGSLAQIIDNNSSTPGIRITGAGGELSFDLGSAKAVGAVGMFMDNNGGNNQACTWSVLYSDNNSDFTDTSQDIAYSDNSEASSVEVIKTFSGSHGTHRYWKLKVESKGGESASSGGIYGINLYADNAHNITFDGNSNMQPDMVWIKKRDSVANSALYDVIRGVNKELRTTGNDAEADVTSGGETGVTAFNSDGFTVGDRGEINGTGNTFVAWAWKAGGSASTVSSGMTQISDASVNSNISRSVNTTAKFSIFTYTGTGNASKIQHGLGVTPQMFWIKCRDTTQGWHVWHKDLDTTNQGYVILNNGQKYETFADFRIWGSNSFPDDTHLMVGTHAGTNNSGDDFVGYAFAGVDGYSRFDKYEGNGTTDNAYIHLGFKPSLFICKNIDSGVDGATQSDWLIFDSIRNPYNDGSANFLKTNLTATESQFNLDFLASGVKIKADNISLGTAETFIYMAWAETPFPLNNRAR